MHYGAENRDTHLAKYASHCQYYKRNLLRLDDQNFDIYTPGRLPVGVTQVVFRYIVKAGRRKTSRVMAAATRQRRAHLRSDVTTSWQIFSFQFLTVVVTATFNIQYTKFLPYLQTQYLTAYSYPRFAI